MTNCLLLGYHMAWAQLNQQKNYQNRTQHSIPRLLNLQARRYSKNEVDNGSNNLQNYPIREVRAIITVAGQRRLKTNALDFEFYKYAASQVFVQILD